MPTGTAAAPEIAALGVAIERDFPDLPVVYQGTETGYQRVCHLMLAHFHPAAQTRAWLLNVAIYAMGLTQDEILKLAGLLVRWEGIGLVPREVGLWNMGSLGEDLWSVLYSLSMLAEQIYPAEFDATPQVPAAGYDVELTINGQRVH